jgi:hypothetical protein
MTRAPSPFSIVASAVALLALAFAPAARADDYHLILFGSNALPERARLTHTWATFVRDPGPAGPPEVCTVSWLPATLAVRPLAARPEPGVNLGLRETLWAVRAQGELVAAFGPYRIDPAAYRRAEAVRARLESGLVGYKAVDSLRPWPGVCNCAHAVCDALSLPHGVVPEVRLQGAGAAAAIDGALRDAGLKAGPPAELDRLLARLGVRDLDGPLPPPFGAPPFPPFGGLPPPPPGMFPPAPFGAGFRGWPRP